MHELVEIMAQTQSNTHFADCAIALQDELREERRGPMLDGQRVGEPEVVFGDDVRENEGPGRSLKSAGLKNRPVTAVNFNRTLPNKYVGGVVGVKGRLKKIVKACY